MLAILTLRILQFFFFFFFLFSFPLFAQTTPLAKRDVAGILRDSLNKPIAGATVRLISIKDTLETSSNSFGYWGFKEVRSAEFLLTVRALGYNVFNRKYFNNDTQYQLNIPQIRLGVKEEQLAAVTITHLKGPKVKGDTTEFWAKDYIVRDYARLEDLLRRMEGITIDQEGSVFYNGERVVKALFNNAQYFSGSVKEAMKELPADIVERIQIIDQNLTATGAKILKSEQSSKVMNIVTKADKSSGRMYDLTFEKGTQGRTSALVNMRKIDGIDQFSTNFGYKQEPLGIKSGQVPGSISKQYTVRRASSNLSDGNSKEINAGFGKNIKIKNFNLNPQYEFINQNRWSNYQTFSENFYSEGTLTKSNNRKEEIQEQFHKITSNFTSTWKNKATLNGVFNINYKDINNKNLANNIQNGIVNNIEKNITNQEETVLEYDFNTDFRMSISPKLNFSLNLKSVLGGNKVEEDEQIAIFGNANISSIADSTINQIRDIKIKNFTNGVQNQFIWLKSKNLKIQMNLGLISQNTLRNIRAYLIENQQTTFQQELSNYQMVNSLAVPVNVNLEYTFDNGLFIVPSASLKQQWITGELNLATQVIDRNDLLFNPGIRVGYANKKVGSFQMSFIQSTTQPNIEQLNPDVYFVTPYEIQIGNPKLRNPINNSYNFRYSNFFEKARLNVSLLSNFSIINKLVVANRFLEINLNKNIIRTINLFENVDGANVQFYRLDLSKTLQKTNSTISIWGNVTRSHHPFLSNGKAEERSTIAQSYKASFFYSPKKWLDIVPELNYIDQIDRNSLANVNRKTFNRIFTADLKLGVYMSKNLTINANMSQSLYRITNTFSNTSTFVLNANIEKRIFKNKNAIVSFVVMDLARQNVLTNYTSNNFGYTNTLTSADSRYFLFQFSWRPQVWGKSKYDKGDGRRGDGSFY